MLWFLLPQTLISPSKVRLQFLATFISLFRLVVFPRDLLTSGFFSKDVGMLGLGDIVIPGIFLALLLRFDNKLVQLICIIGSSRRDRNGSRFYFWTGFVAYIVGLLTTFVVMYVFRHAQVNIFQLNFYIFLLFSLPYFLFLQPALLYLVPTCLGFPLAMALVKGDFNDLMA